MSVAVDLDAIAPGFADSGRDAQRVFRVVLEATANPGHIVAMPDGLTLAEAGGLGAAAAGLGLALLDFESPIWLSPRLSLAAPYFQFHCGSRVVAEPRQARFAFAASAEELPSLEAFDIGHEDYPDRSATLVIETDSLSTAGPLQLRGPGIRDRAPLYVGGVPVDFWQARAQLAPLFPLGIDLIFTCRRRLVALPRTTVVEA